MNKNDLPKMTLLDKALVVSLFIVVYLFMLVTAPYWIAKIVIYIITNVQLHLPSESSGALNEE